MKQDANITDAFAMKTLVKSVSKGEFCSNLVLIYPIEQFMNLMATEE
ncbi:hypothetical protein D0263_11885 [Vibrio parahaemolyticus]|nr:hypothetical protein [Vibrio parahaemolyticus]EGQ9104269.1 hypothetical protein [Vibrio parahaemolyticus]EGQ9621499.1 hypothetical protein [Vibrio parahaemolyticus]EGR2348483.1 hypothetical protein [Vibrio parahaemolyticus]EGR2980959.1 hypothetical protein [Vibrio parahaemolyticus]